MKVLVAGGSGFIGKNFLLSTPAAWECTGTYNTSGEFPEFLIRNGLTHVQPIKVEMRNLDEVKAVFGKNGNEFDICLYVMGNSDIGLSRREPFTDLSYNVHSLINLLQNIKAGKFIFMSSGAVYEGYKSLVNPSCSVNPTIPYSVNKLVSERYIEYFRNNTDSIENFVCIRFFGAYGPMEPARKIYTNLINTFVIEGKNEFKIMGNGKNFIDAMYIDDAIEALMKIAAGDKGNMIIDLCAGHPLTINELIIEVGHIFDREIKLLHEGAAAEYTTFYASPNAMETLFDFRPAIRLPEGMRKFADYMRNQLQS